MVRKKTVQKCISSDGSEFTIQKMPWFGWFGIYDSEKYDSRDHHPSSSSAAIATITIIIIATTTTTTSSSVAVWAQVRCTY